MSTNNITIIKLGGSFLAPKPRKGENDPFLDVVHQFYEGNIDDLKKEMKKYLQMTLIRKTVDLFHDYYVSASNANEKFILIHGAGRIGHSIVRTIPGWKTHFIMGTFSQIISEQFHKKNIPMLTIPSIHHIEPIEWNDITVTKTKADFTLMFKSIADGLVPLLYGDVCLNNTGDWKVVSGDLPPILINEWLAEQQKQGKYKNFTIKRIIFVSQYTGAIEGGFHTKPPNHPDAKLIKKVKITNNDPLCITEDGKTISFSDIFTSDETEDQTGGIFSKVSLAIELVKKYNIPIHLIGMEDLIQVLNGTDKGTTFLR